MLLVYKHALIVLYICLCIACFAGTIVWSLLLFGASTSNTSPSSAATAAPTTDPTTDAISNSTIDKFADAATATNTSNSTETIITIKSDVSVQLLKVVCIILNLVVIPLLIYFFYSYRKTWW